MLKSYFKKKKYIFANSNLIVYDFSCTLLPKPNVGSQNPCLSYIFLCGVNAECRVFSHKPLCTCVEGYEGEPTRGCTQREICKTNFISNSLKLHFQFENNTK